MQRPGWPCVSVLAGALWCASAHGVEPVHLRFMYWGSIDEIGTIRQTVAAFEAAHPGIRVTAERTPGHHVRKLLLQQAGGVAPDVVFMGPLIYLNSSDKHILELGLRTFQALHGTHWQYLMAASVIVVLPLIAIFFLGQRYCIRGITLTGIKA